MPDHPREVDQLEWRIEEFGYDREDRNYYLLDDNRLYRRTEPPPPPAPKAKAKANSKKAIAAKRRESKRRRLTVEAEASEDNQEEIDETQAVEEKNLEPWEVDTFGGFKWECLAISLSDYHELCESLKKSKDPNEKALRERLISEVIPIIEAAEEKQRRKIERRQRELLLMEKMVGAKRSSRLADKQDREKREAEEAEAERKRQADLLAAHQEQERQEKMEQERQYRLMTREQRIKDREYKRLLKEEELARDALEQKKIEEGEIRGSDRNLKQRMEKNKKELEDLDNEEDWTFDCSGCGIHGKNLDDGSHSVACERCSVWQHSKCLGISKSAAEKEDFHFVCRDCRRKEEDAKKPKISLKFRVGTSSSPAPPSPLLPIEQPPQKSTVISVEVPGQKVARPPIQGPMMNGYAAQGSSPPTQPSSSPYRSQPALNNGFYQYDHPEAAAGAPQYGFAGQQYRPSSAGGHQQSVLQQYSPQRISAGYPPQQTPPMINDGAVRSPPPQDGQRPAYYNGVPHQHQNYPHGQRPLAPAQNTPRQLTQSPANGHAANNTGRLPSPVFNRPMMSPTQGNMDVGPVAGISQQSPPMGHATINGASANGYTDQAQNGLPTQLQATPRQRPQPQTAQTPTTQPLSGLSPRKQQTPQPLPPPSMIPQKPNNVSPSLMPLQPNVTPGGGPAEKRTISGTPVFPPVENLRPSPQQLRNMSSTEPVPTPSKQPQPSPQPVVGIENGVSGEASSSPSTNVGESKPQANQHVPAEVQTA
ncbi:hypothetical protein, variant [Exophiala xenobiotica]|nr:hypothetical protein, variant [Exophiala xenobiotica]KIW52805.1 hypothetical protein, variant [Exophiala xenobiotica]